MTKSKSYHWKATDRFGRKQQGLLVAGSLEAAQQTLLRQGFNQLKLSRNWSFSAQVKKTDVNALITQLATMLDSAIPLKEGLRILLQNCENLALYQWINALIADLESGLSFSQSLEKQGKYFSYQERQLIKIGELSGKLPQVCERIAAYRQQALALQRKLQKILFYPVIVLGVSLLLTALLLLFVVPRFAEMYQGNNAQLPAITEGLLILSEGLQQYFFHIIAIIGLTLYFLRLRLRRSIRLNRWKHKLIAALPIIGTIQHLSRIVGFSRSLHLMLHSGIPLNQALLSFLPPKTYGKIESLQGDWVLTDEIELILRRIQQGYAFSESVGTTLFPRQGQQMLQIGEKSGKLVPMLQYIADDYQRRLDHQADLLSQLLEPLLMVIIGGVIGVIMLGMYLPIFNMGAMIQ
ncbi:type II secretion system F family protein [Caviibacterium pharyngocola]|uniref:Type II secretion system F family protein n=1 Tax=Caviibacterium pharyngocola TaxID=28159 RepID=A0A2M8RVY3_9PAST|nr:type II secretion system F family protein [Caviibacterium pharyngocola]PJG83047.1 type II secretion system F family protein [Caviibacterium pharyngocola]